MSHTGGRSMGTTSRGSAGTHRHGVRAIGVVSLIALAINLLPVSAAFAQPPAEPELPAPERLAQAITFTLPASGTIGDTLALEGSADSGLALDYRSDTPDRCAIDGTVLHLDAEGTCTGQRRPGWRRPSCPRSRHERLDRGHRAAIPTTGRA